MNIILKTVILILAVIGLHSSTMAQVYNEYITKCTEEPYLGMEAFVTTGAENGAVLVSGNLINQKGNPLFVSKYNKNGGLDWTYEFDFKEEQFKNLIFRPSSIKVTYPNGHTVVVGNIEDTFFQTGAIFVIRLNQNGDLIYQRIHECLDDFYLEEPENYMVCNKLIVNDVQANLDNSLVLAGYVQDKENGNRKGILIALDDQGRPVNGLIKSITHKGFKNGEILRVNSLYNGGYIALIRNELNGYSEYKDGPPTLVRLDASFNTVWSKEIRTADFDAYEPVDLAISPSFENIYVLGFKGKYQCISKVTTDGAMVWTKYYNTTKMTDGDVLVGIPKFACDREDNLYVAFDLPDISREIEKRDQVTAYKVKNDGLVIWQKQYNYNKHWTYLGGVTMVLNDDVWGPVQDFVMVGTEIRDYSDPEVNGWMARVRTANGTTDCDNTSYNLTVTTWPYGAYNFENEIFRTFLSDVEPKLDRNEPAVMLNKCSDENFHGLLPKNKLIENVRTPIGLESQLSIFPNPNQGNFILQIPSPAEVAEVSIFDLTGKRIHSQRSTAGQQSIQLTDLPKGSYFIRCIQGQKTTTTRVVIQ